MPCPRPTSTPLPLPQWTRKDSTMVPDQGNAEGVTPRFDCFAGPDHLRTDIMTRANPNGRKIAMYGMRQLPSPVWGLVGGLAVLVDGVDLGEGGIFSWEMVWPWVCFSPPFRNKRESSLQTSISFYRKRQRRGEKSSIVAALLLHGCICVFLPPIISSKVAHIICKLRSAWKVLSRE